MTPLIPKLAALLLAKGQTHDQRETLGVLKQGLVSSQQHPSPVLGAARELLRPGQGTAVGWET